jgi:two-component system, sensor histidine kinase and response regulator
MNLEKNIKPPNILVVDDTPANLKVLTELLKEYQYKVRAVPSGKMALKAVALAPPDLILLDINMPEMNGYEVCHQLKQVPLYEHIPIIFISALDDIQDKVQAFKQGGVDYITKPFQIEEVHSRIKTHLTLGELQRELQEKNQRLEVQVTQLQKLENLRDNLMYMIVHDLRIPLTGIVAYVSYLIENAKGFPKIYITYLKRTAKSLEHLMGNLNTLLELGKLESIEIKLNYESIEFSTLLKTCLNELDMWSMHLHVHVTYPPKKIYIKADRNLLKRIIINLLSNAFKFTLEDKNIFITLYSEADWVRFEVRDEGPGIAEIYLDKVFEKFGQAEIQKEQPTAASGLGLAFCKLAVEAHSGHIGLKSEVGKGSTFWFEMPLSPP